MAMTTTTSSALLKPADVEKLLVAPALSASIASAVSTVVRTSAASHRLPAVQTDPSARWTAEGGEIVPSDLGLSEVLVTPAKLAALTIISRELADDSSPAAAIAVGDGMARDIARQLDAAYFGALAAPAPAGLAALAGTTNVDAGASFANLDAFLEAISRAETVGSTITAFIASPGGALALAKLRSATGSLVPLLSPSAASPTGRVIAGIPLYVSRAVPNSAPAATGIPAVPATVWAIAKDRSVVVLRSDSRIDVDASAYFSSDRVAIRGTLRAAFGFAHPQGLVKITAAA